MKAIKETVRLVSERKRDICEFLKMIVPQPFKEAVSDQLYIEVRLIGTSGGADCRFLPISQEGLSDGLAQIVQEAEGAKVNVYVGVALRNSNLSGKASNCEWLNTFVVDYDEVGGVKLKDIADANLRQEAKAKMLSAIRSLTDFSPTLIVDSGNGFHAYFALRTSVRVQENINLIKRRSRWLGRQLADYPGDSAMLNIAQPIRIPGSYNFKNPEIPLMCQIVECHSERVFDFEAIPEAEPKVAVARPSLPKKVSRVKARKNGEDQGQSVWKCRFLEWMRRNPDKQTYHLWMSAASTLAVLGETGRSFFHELSRQYHKYCQEEANALFDTMLKSQASGVGPVSYEKLKDYGFDESDVTTAASPGVFVERIWQFEEAEKLGISVDAETERVQFNPNVFVKFFAERHELVILGGARFLLYEQQRGCWGFIEEIELMRQVRDHFEEVLPDIFRGWMGDDAVEMLRLAVPMIAEVDGNRDFLNLENGMLDLNTFQLLPHSPEYLSTIQIPIAFSSESESPLFEKTVSQILSGDAAKVAVFQELFGYFLSPETCIHKVFFLYGEGANGKSLLLDVVSMVLGKENISNVSLGDLSKPFYRAALVGKTANISTENEISRRGFNSQYVKSISSGDPIQAEFKYKDPISVKPTCKLVFAVNSLPTSTDTSYGLFRRIFILPFNERFEGENADVQLVEKIKKELPGVLNWALAGLKRLRENNYRFTKCTEIEEAVDQYQRETNFLFEFMKTRLSSGNYENRVGKKEFLEKFDYWCRQNGYPWVDKNDLQRFWSQFRSNCKLLNLKYVPKNSNNIAVLRYLSMKDPEVDNLADDVDENLD